jgi:hypothetical protein
MPSLLDFDPKQEPRPFTSFGEPSEWQMIDLAGHAMLLAAVVVGGLMLLLASRNFYRGMLLRRGPAVMLSGQQSWQSRGANMNPLNWKREHQIALFCAAALGCLVGIIAGTL